jgi:hypothetical protein
VNSIDIADVLAAGPDCLPDALVWGEIQQSTPCMCNITGFETRPGHSTFFEIGRATTATITQRASLCHNQPSTSLGLFAHSRDEDSPRKTVSPRRGPVWFATRGEPNKSDNIDGRRLRW